MASVSPNPKLLENQEVACWAGFYTGGIMSGKTADQAIEIADRGTAALRERMRSRAAEHYRADREAQREADELAAKTR